MTQLAVTQSTFIGSADIEGVNLHEWRSTGIFLPDLHPRDLILLHVQDRTDRRLSDSMTVTARSLQTLNPESVGHDPQSPLRKATDNMLGIRQGILGGVSWYVGRNDSGEILVSTPAETDHKITFSIYQTFDYRRWLEGQPAAYQKGRT